MRVSNRSCRSAVDRSDTFRVESSPDSFSLHSCDSSSDKLRNRRECENEDSAFRTGKMKEKAKTKQQQETEKLGNTMLDISIRR